MQWRRPRACQILLEQGQRMKRFTAVAFFVSSMLIAGNAMLLLAYERNGGGNVNLYLDVHRYVADRVVEFERIPVERKKTLGEVVDYIQQRVTAGQPARLTFVCTHNSRRSQLSQVWAAVAAAYYQVPAVEAYSGGTETTAFNPRAVRALERAGLRIDRVSDDQNPVYRVTYAEGVDPLVCFSKLYAEAPNPDSDFCAVMTCSQADDACPHVAGAAARIALPYNDPQEFDDTERETEMYAERSAQIAREMLYVFSRATGRSNE